VERAGAAETIELPICDQYTIQGDLFSRAILDRRPAPAPLEDSVANMACLDAIVRSVETGRWEAPTRT
jgi:predicted dehydrogenase